MIYAAMLSLGITIVLFLLSIIFKLAGKLRLPLPVIYFLLISTVLNKWETGFYHSLRPAEHHTHQLDCISLPRNSGTPIHECPGR